MGKVALPLTDLYAPISVEMRHVRDLFDRELASELSFVDELCQTVGNYRGKMLRPALILLSGKAGGELCKEHITLAAVVEMVHIATLVHDDVLDEAVVRRRRLTVNRTNGNEAAVLLGDFLISHAFHLCSSLDSQDASRLIGATTNRVCEGELMQVHHRGDISLTEEQYLDIISRKTAALTATCCRLGARYAGADEDVISLLENFGHNAGMAFQIVDDVLDLVGTENEMGKTLGRDLAKGEYTLPIIHHMSSGTPSQRKMMQALVLTQISDIREQLRDMLEESSSLEYAMQLARGYVESALCNLSELKPTEARDCLTAMAEFILQRRF